MFDYPPFHDQMIHFLLALHSFRGQNNGVEFLSQEVDHQKAADLVVVSLFGLRIDLAFGFVKLVQDGQGLRIDVMI